MGATQFTKCTGACPALLAWNQHRAHYAWAHGHVHVAGVRGHAVRHCIRLLHGACCMASVAWRAACACCM
eukprot:54414-Chlamydomonas_euryale.AAC.1